MRECAPSRLDTLAHLLEKLLVLFNIACRAYKGLLDDMLRFYKRTEHLRGHPRDSSPTSVVGTSACERCRGANTLQVPGRQSIFDTAYQQRHVGSLATTIRMQFIQHQKLQHFRSKHPPLGSTCETQFKHDIVGEQDIWRICNDALSLFIRILAGVTLKGDRTSVVGITQAQKLLQFLHLAIRQRVHRIDDDGLDTTPCTITQNIINDRDNVSKAFAGTCASGKNITCATVCDMDCIGLMFVQS